MKWPDAPKEASGAAKAEYEYEKRKLELRMADLKRYQIQPVMIDAYDEIPQILEELNRRSHLKHVFVSGSAYDFEPLGKDRLETFSATLGREIIKRGYNLVSGFGLGIGGAVILGSLEEVYSDSLPTTRVSLLPFPQKRIGQAEFHTQHRTSILSSSGFVIFLSGNRYDDTTKKPIEAHGVVEEFELAVKLGKIVIPFGASGWAAWEIWKNVMSKPETYYSADVSAPLKTLGEPGKTDDEYLGGDFSNVEDFGQLVSCRSRAYHDRAGIFVSRSAMRFAGEVSSLPSLNGNSLGFMLFPRFLEVFFSWTGMIQPIEDEYAPILRCNVHAAELWSGRIPAALFLHDRR